MAPYGCVTESYRNTTACDCCTSTDSNCSHTEVDGHYTYAITNRESELVIPIIDSSSFKYFEDSILKANDRRNVEDHLKNNRRLQLLSVMKGHR